jgi:hypothetical protein
MRRKLYLRTQEVRALHSVNPDDPRPVRERALDYIKKKIDKQKATIAASWDANRAPHNRWPDDVERVLAAQQPFIVRKSASNLPKAHARLKELVEARRALMTPEQLKTSLALKKYYAERWANQSPEERARRLAMMKVNGRAHEARYRARVTVLRQTAIAEWRSGIRDSDALRKYFAKFQITPADVVERLPAGAAASAAMKSAQRAGTYKRDKRAKGKSSGQAKADVQALVDGQAVADIQALADAQDVPVIIKTVNYSTIPTQIK